MESDRTLDLQAALDEAGWLRALAVRLVGTAWADDVVQDTYLAALAREDAPREWRAWLGRVAQRIASNTRRREARLTALKERVADRDESATDPAAQLQERLHLQRLLLQAVDELEPDFCAAVVGCYMDGLTPSELAAQLGIPAGTVRSRLSRALASLREKLDGELGRDRWLGALLPWVAHLDAPLVAPPGLPHTLPPPNGSAAALSHLAPVQGVAAGLFGMIGGLGLIKWMSAVVIAATAVGLWWLWPANEPLDASAPIRVARDSGERALATLPQPDEAPIADRHAVEADSMALAQPAKSNLAAPPPKVSLWLDVIDAETREPIEGAEFVALKDAPQIAARGDLTAEFGSPVAVSKALGALQVTSAATTQRTGFVRKAGYSERLVWLTPEFVSIRVIDERWTVEMWPLERLKVRVVNSVGEPLPGAIVQAVADPAALDAGKPRWGVGAQSAGAWDGRYRRRAKALTDERGETWIDGFAAFVPLELEVEIDGRLALAARLDEAERFGGSESGGRNVIELRVLAEASLSGKLVRSDGTPIVGQALFLRFAWLEAEPPGTWLKTKTDRFGRFDFPSIPSDKHGERPKRLRANVYLDRVILANGEILEEHQLDWSQAQANHLDVELSTIAVLEIGGMVLDDSGNGLFDGAGGWVEVTQDGTSVASAMLEQGSFVVEGLTPGQYELSFRFGSNARGPEVLAWAGEKDVRLQAPVNSKLELHLVRHLSESNDLQIGNSFKFYAQPYQDPAPVQFSILQQPAAMAAEQTLPALSLNPGRYRVVVSTLDDLIGLVDLNIVKGELNRMDVPMQRGAKLHIKFAPGVQGSDALSFTQAGRVVGWTDSWHLPVLVAPGSVLVEWRCANGSVAQIPVVARAGEVVDVLIE